MLTKKYDDAVAAHQAEIEAEKQRRSKKNKRIAIIASSVIVAVIALVLIVTKVILPANDYKKAINLLESGEYISAEKAFVELGDYKDSQTMVLESRLRKAKEHIAHKEYAQAYAILRVLQDYSDASHVLLDGKISEANEYIQAGDFEKGYGILNSLGEGDLVNENIYHRAETALAKKEYDIAHTLFSSLKGYKDASEQAQEAKYQKACDLLEDKNYDAANPIFEGLGDYKDSKNKIHYHDYQVKDSKTANCTEGGHSTYYCEGCLDEYTEQIKELGHSYSGATCTKASICSRCGAQEKGALGHTTTTGVCSRCKYNFTAPLYFSGCAGSEFGKGRGMHALTLPYGKYRITMTVTKLYSYSSPDDFWDADINDGYTHPGKDYMTGMGVFGYGTGSDTDIYVGEVKSGGYVYVHISGEYTISIVPIN